MIENWVKVMTRFFPACFLLGLSDSPSLVMFLLTHQAFGILKMSGFHSNWNSRCPAGSRSFSSVSVTSYALSLDLIYIFVSVKSECT